MCTNWQEKRRSEWREDPDDVDFFLKCLSNKYDKKVEEGNENIKTYFQYIEILKNALNSLEFYSHELPTLKEIHTLQ